MGLLKTILILVLLYYGFKILVRLFAPFLVSKVASTMQKKAQEQYNQQQSNSSVKEGETVIDKAPNTSKQSTKKVGEYVDFEEID